MWGVEQAPSTFDQSPATADTRSVDWRLVIFASGTALATIIFAAVLTTISRNFGYDTDVEDMPTLGLVALLVTAGAAFGLAIPRLATRTEPYAPRQHRKILALVLIAGAAARLILLASEPMLEDDYNRYLWDGAVVAHGLNPYAHSPLAVHEGRAPQAILDLGRQSGAILERINHKSLTTIYPPVAQTAFAISHLIAPFDVTAWRGLLFVCDLATLLCLIGLLDTVGRSRLWVALYWLNPVVLKEVSNSGHMEAILLPLVMLSLLLVSLRRPLWAATSLGLAVGVKFWPILLAPLILRSLWGNTTRLCAALVILAGMMALWLLPMLLTDATADSGLIAYVDRWKTNSALFPALEIAIFHLQNAIGGHQIEAGIIARTLIAATLTTLAIAIAWQPITDTRDLISRASIVVAALVLLSPAQYPWYTVWFAPFLVFHPYTAFLLLSAAIPLYYTKFYFVAHDQGELFSSTVVWLIWGPVLAVTLARVIATRATWLAQWGPTPKHGEA